MKRIPTLLLALVLIIWVAACASEPETENCEPDIQEITEIPVHEIEEPDTHEEVESPTPEAEEPATYNAEDYEPPAVWTDGARLTEPTALEAGDYFLGWRVVYASNSEGGGTASFEGAAQVTGTLRFGHIGEFLSFWVTGDAEMLPMHVIDSRVIWFELGGEEVQRLAEAMQATIQPRYNGYRYYEIENSVIVISNYSYICLPMAVWNVATLAEVVYIPGLDWP